MTINYYGQDRAKKFNTRVAAITFNENEEVLADRIIDLMLKVTSWHDYYIVENEILIPVDDYNDYQEFKNWYKPVKKMFSQCMRHGF